MCCSKQSLSTYAAYCILTNTYEVYIPQIKLCSTKQTHEEDTMRNTESIPLFLLPFPKTAFRYVYKNILRNSVFLIDVCISHSLFQFLHVFMWCLFVLFILETQKTLNEMIFQRQIISDKSQNTWKYTCFHSLQPFLNFLNFPFFFFFHLFFVTCR